jgi:hypothetical protein
MSDALASQFGPWKLDSSSTPADCVEAFTPMEATDDASQCQPSAHGGETIDEARGVSSSTGQAVSVGTSTIKRDDDNNDDSFHSARASPTLLDSSLTASIDEQPSIVQKPLEDPIEDRKPAPPLVSLCKGMDRASSTVGSNGMIGSTSSVEVETAQANELEGNLSAGNHEAAQPSTAQSTGVWSGLHASSRA